MDTETNVVPEAPKPGVLVYDIPADATPEETAQIIGQHEGYYLLAAMPWPGVGARVFLRQHALLTRPKPPKPVQEPTATPTEREREDVQADAILQRYPRMAAGKVSDKLAEHGIVRHPLWVASRRSMLERAETAANARREA